MYSNNIVNFQESTTIFKCLYKKSLETYRMHHVEAIRSYSQSSSHLQNLTFHSLCQVS